MRLTPTAALLVTALLFVLARPAYAQRFEGNYLHEITPEVVSPHLNWATPLAGGPIRATFISPRNLGAREIIEAEQRMSLDVHASAIFAASSLIHDSVYEAAVRGTSRSEKTAELIDTLKHPADVIVLGNIDFDVLPPEVQFRIVEHVIEGSGLVLTYDRPFPLKKLLSQPTQDGETIVAGVDVAELPKPLRTMAPGKLLQTYQFGKGRIAWLRYSGTPSAVNGGPSLTVDETYSTQWKSHYENNLALVLRAIRWAAGHDSDTVLRMPILANDSSFTAEELSTRGVTFHVTGDWYDQTKVVVRVRDRWNRVLWTGEAMLSDDGSATVHPARLPTGRYTLDVRVVSPSGVEDFGYAGFTLTGAMGEATLTTVKTSFESGETINAEVSLERPADVALKVRFRLADLPYGRVWAEQSQMLAAGSDHLNAKIQFPPMPTSAGTLWCDVMRDGTIIATAQQTLFFPDRILPHYPKILWSAIPETMPELFAHQVVDQQGWRAGLTHPAGGTKARRMAMLDQQIVPYMTRIGLDASKTEGKAGWTYTRQFLGMNKSQIDQQLGDDQSFYNPAVQAMWKRNIDRRIKNLPQYGPMLYSLGDENNLSYDAGYSPSDHQAFIDYARNRYGDIDKLNTQWGSDFKNFEDLRQPTPEELRKSQNFPAWLDQRNFMEQQYADTHRFLADYIRSIDPHAWVGAEGSVPGDLELILKGLDFWGPYSDPVKDELLRALAPDKLRTLWWGGYTSHGGQRDGIPTKQWRWLLKGVVNGSSWYNGRIASDGFLGIDFSYADYYKRMIPHLRALARGQAQLLIDQPLKRNGVAVLWSHTSESVSVMDDRFTSPSVGTEVLLDVGYHSGVNFDFLTPSTLTDQALADQRVLLLPGTSALSAETCQILTRFVERGGIVIADLNPAVLNQYAKPLDRSALGALFGIETLNWQPELKLAPVSIDQTVAGQRIRFNAAKVWQSPMVVPFTIHRQGKGLAILLNMNLASARATASSATPFEPFIMELLALADIRPAVQVEGVQRDKMLLRIRKSGDCTTIGLLVDADDADKTATLTLPTPAYVYRADGELIGHGRTVSVTCDPPFQLLCAFEQQPLPPTVKLSDSSVVLGDSTVISPQGLSEHGVYRIEMIAPNGKPMLRRTRVFHGLGKSADRTLRLALNDASGRYTVKVTDVRTGLSATATLDAAKPEEES